MSNAPRLSTVQLESFKSFERAVLPLGRVTVLTGRNSGGKSNALDAIDVLSRLAAGEDIGDALDGRRREGGAVRGGSAGCAPHGSDRFSLGCTVDVGNRQYQYRVSIQVKPELRVIREVLKGPAPALASGKVELRDLVYTRNPEEREPGLQTEVFNGMPGRNPMYSFRDSRLVISQIASVVPGGNKAERAVLSAVEAVLGALRGCFNLDPISYLMREYVPERDSDLRRTGENVSAALSAMSSERPETFARIVSLVQEVADPGIASIDVSRSSLGDVMLTLVERRAGRPEELTPAREMSDGLLRFIAIATALLTSSHGLDIRASPSSLQGVQDPSVLMVIEELENGLHPSQARRMLDLVLEASRADGTGVLFTTHSPAMLTAAEGDLIKDVLVCYRDPDTGHSQIARMVDIPGYAEAMAEGSLGEAVSKGKLTEPVQSKRDYSRFNQLLGLQ